jgi:hypothetical protein
MAHNAPRPLVSIRSAQVAVAMWKLAKCASFRLGHRLIYSGNGLPAVSGTNHGTISPMT